MSDRMKSSNLYFPEFGGSTGGWLEAAETEEKYVMTWSNERKKPTIEDNIFEMPTGGAAIMKEGPNLVYFARKELFQVGKFNLFIQKMVYSQKK